MLPANGCVTAIAKPTATAASTALPPFCSTRHADVGRDRLHGHDHAVAGAHGLTSGVDGNGEDQAERYQREQCSSH